MIYRFCRACLQVLAGILVVYGSIFLGGLFAVSVGALVTLFHEGIVEYGFGGSPIGSNIEYLFYVISIMVISYALLLPDAQSLPDFGIKAGLMSAAFFLYLNVIFWVVLGLGFIYPPFDLETYTGNRSQYAFHLAMASFVYVPVIAALSFAVWRRRKDQCLSCSS